MIRYSFRGGTYYWTRPGAARSDLLRWLEAEYLELLELRERVRKAEETAQRQEQQRQEQRDEQFRRDTQKTAADCVEPGSVPHSDRRHPPRRRPRR
jgi:hypothetical protein